MLVIDDSRRCLVLRDQAGLPAAGATVQIGEATHTVPKSGLLELPAPLPHDASVRVEAIRVA